jgi:acetyltransferase
VSTAVGFGGIFVELLGDTAMRLAPVSTVEARSMLAELRMAPALQGFRGRPSVDLDALADTVGRFSRLVLEVPSLLELEINPLLAGPGGARGTRHSRSDGPEGIEAAAPRRACGLGHWCPTTADR